MSSPKKQTAPSQESTPTRTKALEKHIFRCAVDDFQSLLKHEKEYRYEYTCGEKLLSAGADPINMWIEVFASKDKSKSGYLQFKGGVQKRTKLQTTLSVIPKLLHSDGSVYISSAERTVNLKTDLTLKWDETNLDIQTMQNKKSVTGGNKCLFEFHVTLELNQVEKQTTTLEAIRKKVSFNNGNDDLCGGVKRAASSDLESEEIKRRKIKLDSMQSKLAEDLKGLLECKEHADVCFVIGGETLKAHRIILAARSQAFAGLLTDESKVDGAWNINITTDVSVMKILLEYIYTGKLVDEWKSCADQLLSSANQYGLTELIEYLDLKIPEFLTVDNASVFLVLSKNLKLKNLDEEMTKFFVRNRDEIIKSKGFQELREKNPAVLVDWLLAKN